MGGHPLPLFVGELARLLEKIEWDARLPDVVHQRGESQLVELQLRHPQTPPQSDRENAHVHGVSKSVLVVITDRRKTNERRLFIQHLIDYSLHNALDLSDVGRFADSHG